MTKRELRHCRRNPVCERGGDQQRIGLTDLPLPSSQPSGAKWIAAYRRWLHGRTACDRR